MHLLGTGNGGLLGAAGTTLAAGKVLGLAGNLLRGLLDNLGALSEDHLNVAGVGHVRVDLYDCQAVVRRGGGTSSSTYATVSTVCAATLLRGLVDLDVLDNQVAGVETLGVGVGLGVLEEREKELSALGGPAGLGDTESLAFRYSISIRMQQCLLLWLFSS
jgi:hypothetical protein